MPALIRGVKASAMPTVTVREGSYNQLFAWCTRAGPNYLTIMMTEGCLDMVPYAVS